MHPRSSPPHAVLVVGLLVLGLVTPSCGGKEESAHEPGDETGAPGDPNPEPPVADATGPASIHVGDIATLDGSASTDPQGLPITSYRWTCSDGQTAVGAVAEVTFAAAGVVTCTLLVTATSDLSSEDMLAIEVLENPLPEWTVMVYLNGDNDLEDAALEDLNEMEQVGSDDQVQVVVQLDRARGGYSGDGDWTGARRYLVQADTDWQHVASPVLEDLGAVDSGVPETIAGFATWAIDSFPARRYALVLWDHGEGWTFAGSSSGRTKSVSMDHGTGHELSIVDGDLNALLATVTDHLGGPLDLLGMDACLMGAWEMAYASMPYAGTYVASQASEGMDGWAWDASLADLVATPTMDPAALGESFALRFHETGDSTLSVVDLSGLPAFNEALDALAQTLLQSGDTTAWEQATNDALTFSYGSGDVDAGDLLDLLLTHPSCTPEVAEAASALKGRLSEIVLSNYTSGRQVERAQGMSIYAPDRRINRDYLSGVWSDGTSWDDWLSAASAGP